MKQIHLFLTLSMAFWVSWTPIRSQSIDPSAALEINSTTQGFLLPRLTTAQRNAISSPAQGLMVYNTSTNKLNVYNGTQWLTAPFSPPPISFLTDTDGDTQIQLEQTNDDDIIRFDIEGNQNMLVQLSSSGRSEFVISEGSKIRFPHANQINPADGSIGAGLYTEGLNIVGIQTVAGNGRFIKYYGSLAAASDISLKDKNFTYQNILPKINTLQAINFDWKKDNTANEVGKNKVGLIAQEVEAVFPEIVSTDSNGLKSVSYVELIPLIVQGMKELTAENEVLKMKIKILERKK